MFLGLQDPDLLVRDMDLSPDPDPSLFLPILTQNFGKSEIIKTEDNVPSTKLEEKIWKNNFFGIVIVIEERSRIRIY
jgi:hypothetical protein